MRDLMQKHLELSRSKVSGACCRRPTGFVIADSLEYLNPGEVRLAFSKNLINMQPRFNEKVLSDIGLVEPTAVMAHTNQRYSNSPNSEGPKAR